MCMGLVLGGGGAKGAYEAGVWKALSKLDMTKDIKAVSGSSAGGLNAALFAMGDFCSCFRLWRSITESDILYDDGEGLSLLSIALGYDSIFSRSCIENIIKNNISPITDTDCFIACSDISRIPFLKLLPAELFINKRLSLSPEYFNLRGESEEKTVNILLATTAIPFIYESVKIGKKRYCDGGLCDNLPIKPLYDAGYRKIIAVSLDTDTEIEQKKFPDSEIVLIKPSRDPGNFFSGTLNFTREKLENMIYLGYTDTLALLGDKRPPL